MDSTIVPVLSTSVYPSALPAAQPLVRKPVRKAILNPTALASPGQEQQSTFTPGSSRSVSVDISASQQQGCPSQLSELYRSNTATSAASSSRRSSVLSSNAPLSPLSNITAPSPLASPFQADPQSTLGYTPQQVALPTSCLAVCTQCNGGRFQFAKNVPPWQMNRGSTFINYSLTN